jgi:hypothetical protein
MALSAFISGEICFCEKQLATYLPQERETAGFNYQLPLTQLSIPFAALLGCFSLLCTVLTGFPSLTSIAIAIRW